jgi:hypothetical protein
VAPGGGPLSPSGFKRFVVSQTGFVTMTIFAIFLVVFLLAVKGEVFYQQRFQDVLHSPTGEHMDRAIELMQKYPLIDGHNVISTPPSSHGQDLAMLIRYLKNNTIYENFTFDNSFVGDTDIPRLRTGLVGGQFWSTYVPWYRNL